MTKEIGCTQCPYAGHIELKECPDAYTEVSQHCALYKHEPINSEEGKKEMTNEEAIKILEEMPIASNVHFEEIAEALNLAIKSLENERPRGKWIRRRYINGTDWSKSFDMYVCSNCYEEFSWDAETGISMDNYNTCPNCTADMR